MKIIIINPPAYKNKEYIREGRCMQTKSSWVALWMPLSLAYLAAFLRRDGHEVLLIDCIAEKINQPALKKIVVNFSPNLTIINTALPSIKGDIETATNIKSINPEIKTIIFGMYPTLFEKKSLEDSPGVDFAIVGEPEWTVTKLVMALNERKDLETINGLIYRKGNEIVLTKPQDFSSNNLDQIPFPARDLLNNEKYRLPTNGEKFTLLSVGRGCPFNCIFCIANIYYGKKLRKRPVESIISEIEECVKKYNINNFLFWGENFTLDPDYGEKICDSIIQKKLKIHWSTTSRVDTLNEILLKKMKQAGCLLLGLGIESANQEILDRAKKQITVSQIKKAISMVKESGIYSVGHFIFGLPGETKKTAAETINFACNSDLNYAHFYCAIPYPKTELEEITKNKKLIETQDPSCFDLSKASMRTETLTAKEIKKLRDLAYFKFYLRPKIIFQTIKEIKSLRAFFSILNFLNWIKPKD